MNEWIVGLCYVLAGYLSGTILFAKIFVSKFCGENIVLISKDGNPGTANAFAAGGIWIGGLTLLCELGKGFLPVYLYCRSQLEVPDWMIAPVLVAPVLGHAFPLLMRGRGGKGIAVTFGCLLGLAPCWAPVMILVASFLFFSLIVVISPHQYRTAVAVFAAAIATMIVMSNPRIRCGVCINYCIILIRLLLSREERTECKVRLFWKRLR